MKLRAMKRQEGRQCEQRNPIRLPYRNRLRDGSPLGFYAGDTNLYRYVGNDPTNATDPSGLIKQSNQEFWNTDYGKKFWAEIQKAAEEVKELAKLLIAAAGKIDPAIKKKYADEIKSFIDRMQYIIDNVDSITISVNFNVSDVQATPSGKNENRRVVTVHGLKADVH